MNEKDFGQAVSKTLNRGLSGIGEAELARLRKSRQLAMDAYREPVSVLGLATVSGQLLDVGAWARKPVFWLPVLAVAAILTYAGMSSDDVYDDVGELDAKLLTGELPIDAFLDKDFASWVKESS